MFWRKFCLLVFFAILYLIPTVGYGQVVLSNPAPVKIKASSDTTKLSWTDSATNYWSYRIYIDKDAANYDGQYLKNVSYNTRSTNINLKGLAAGTYYFYVRKYSWSGYEYSNYVAIAVNSSPVVTINQPTTNQAVDTDDGVTINYSLQDNDDSSLDFKLKLDKDTNPGNGNEKLLMANSSGLVQASYDWQPDFNFTGKYYVYGYADDGLNSSYAYSNGYIQVAPDPKKPATILSPTENLQAVGARDFATDNLVDPWDMSNPEDTNHIINFENVSISNGLWSGRTTSRDAYFWLMWGGYPGAYSTIRDGTRNSIDTDLYKRVTFKMYLSDSDGATGTIYWFYSQDLSNKGFVNFNVYQGWNIYQIDLPWSGRPISFRLDPVQKANTDVIIDWVSLSNKQGFSTNLQWSDNKKGQPQLFLDSDSAGYDGSFFTNLSTLSRTNTQTIDFDGLFPDNYYLYILKSSGSLSGYSSALININSPPIVQVIEPNEEGGRDWAKTVLKNPWDMNSRKDISSFHNIAGASFKRGVLSGVNGRGRGGKRANDPYLLLNLKGRAIDSNRFHRLTFRYKFGDTFSLERGTMSRFGWTVRPLNDPKYWQMSDDILTYDGWNTVTVDLKKIALNRGNFGWRSRITRLRFDPHEDPYARRFFIDSIALREDDRLVKSFAIKFKVKDNDPNVGIGIYRDKDRVFGNGNESKITNLSVAPGTYSWKWKPSRKVRGLYWIYIQANDSKDTRGYYSTGPLRVH